MLKKIGYFLIGIVILGILIWVFAYVSLIGGLFVALLGLIMLIYPRILDLPIFAKISEKIRPHARGYGILVLTGGLFLSMLGSAILDEIEKNKHQPKPQQQQQQVHTTNPQPAVQEKKQEPNQEQPKPQPQPEAKPNPQPEHPVLQKSDSAKTSSSPPPQPKTATVRKPKPPRRATSNTQSKTSTSQTVYYKNCSQARAAGAAPIYRGEPGYRPALDRDRDGIACE